MASFLPSTQYYILISIFLSVFFFFRSRSINPKVKEEEGNKNPQCFIKKAKEKKEKRDRIEKKLKFRGTCGFYKASLVQMY